MTLPIEELSPRAKMLISSNNWISVEKELPPLGLPVLFAVVGNSYCEYGYRREENWQSVETAPQDEPIYFDNEQVTYWQPVPKVPGIQP